MRLDKLLCDLNIGSRKQVKLFIKNRLVKVNDIVAIHSEMQVDPTKDIVIFQGKQLVYQKYYYYCMNKPAGVITATEDKHEKTVMQLFSKEAYRDDLFPIGRLDKDTTGLLLFTNDGELGHRLLSAKYHVFKTYLVTCKLPVSEENRLDLEQGVDIGEDSITLPAKCMICENSDGMQIELSIREGKFHQVKRMLQAIGNEVVTLKRISFGNITLDKSLEEGKIRSLNQEEIAALYQAVSLKPEE